MRYILAIFCPPLALLACRKTRPAIACGLLFALAILTAPWGIGAILDFFLVLWATHAVGADLADREVQAFVRTVKPIPVIHER